jgi:transposase
VIAEQNIDSMEAAQLREVVRTMLAQAKHKDAVIEKLTHENAVLKRLKFAAQSERFNAEQRSLLEETLDADLQAVAEEIERLTPVPSAPSDRQQAKRKPLPANLPRREIRHEPENTTCTCGCQMKRIGEDVAEKLDYVPGVFTVERHIRGKWACAKCERLVQAPVAPHIIDKGIPTAGLVAQVLVAKYADHLPLYRQETIFERAGLAIARSTLAQWVGSAGVQLQPLVNAMRDDLLRRRVLHADETPVAMLDPGAGKTKRAYQWSYCSTRFVRAGWWCSTSPTGEPAGTPWGSRVTRAGKPGAVRWSATITPDTGKRPVIPC